jgi:hypothetical protein
VLGDGDGVDASVDEASDQELGSSLPDADASGLSSPEGDDNWVPDMEGGSVDAVGGEDEGGQQAFGQRQRFFASKRHAPLAIERGLLFPEAPEAPKYPDTLFEPESARRTVLEFRKLSADERDEMRATSFRPDRRIKPMKLSTPVMRQLGQGGAVVNALAERVQVRLVALLEANLGIEFSAAHEDRRVVVMRVRRISEAIASVLREVAEGLQVVEARHVAPHVVVDQPFVDAKEDVLLTQAQVLALRRQEEEAGFKQPPAAADSRWGQRRRSGGGRSRGRQWTSKPKSWQPGGSQGSSRGRSFGKPQPQQSQQWQRQSSAFRRRQGSGGGVTSDGEARQRF